MGMMENILMRKCNMTYKQAKKTAATARENLDMSKQSLLWSRELEVECFRIVDEAKEAANAKLIASFDAVKPTIVHRTIGGDEESNLSLSETESDRPHTPPPTRSLDRDPQSASSFRHKKRGKSAGRAAGRRLLLSPQKRRASVTIGGKSSELLEFRNDEPSQAAIQPTESTTSLSSALLREREVRQASDDNCSLLTGGSQESVCSGDSKSESRFRRTKRTADGRRPSLSRLKLRQNSSENKENSGQDHGANSMDSSTHTASESIATTGSSSKKDKKKKKKTKLVRAIVSSDDLEPASATKKSPTKKKKKKDRTLDSSNHTTKSAGSSECPTPRASGKLQQHLFALSPSKSADDVKKVKKKSTSREHSDRATTSTGNAEDQTSVKSRKLQRHLAATSPTKSVEDAKKISRRSSKKKSATEETSTQPTPNASSSLMENGTIAIPQEVIDAFADCDSSERRNSRLHVRLKKSPKKRPKESVGLPDKSDQHQDSSRSLLSTMSNSSTGTKTRMLPVLRTSPKSPTKETRERFNRPVKSCGTGTKLKYPRRPSDSTGLRKSNFPSSPTKIQERYASFVANNCDSPESFLSIDDSFSASQCSDFFVSPESSKSSNSLPCVPSLSPNMFNSSMSSLTAPRQPRRQTSGVGGFLGTG